METRRSYVWGLTFCFILSLLTFVIVPFSGDEQIFLGSSKMADYLGKGIIYNSFNVWEIKGVFTRLLFYLLYKFVSSIARCPSMIFSIVLSLVYAGGVIALSLVISCNIASSSDTRIILTELISTGFFTVDSWCKMQSEMTCALLLLLSLSIALKKGKRRVVRLIFSGMIISLLFWFKVPLLLLSLCFAAGIMLLSRDGEKNKIRQIFIVAISALIFLVLVGIVVYLINPDEYLRMYMTSIYQGTLLSGDRFSVMSVIKGFLSGYAQAMVTLPALLIGSACFITNFFYCLNKRKFAQNCYHFILWATPALYVIISNCFFIYHYLVFFPAALIEIWIFINHSGLFGRGINWMKFTWLLGGYFVLVAFSYLLQPIIYFQYNRYILEFIGVALLIILIAFCLMHKDLKHLLFNIIPIFSISIFFTYIALLCNNSISYIKLQSQSYNNDYSLPMASNQKMLYLDNGVGAYYFGYDTFYEEFYPLILQKIDEGSERSKLERYIDASKKILSYNGEFVCLEDEFIFPNGKNPTLKNKIMSEYKLYKSYNIYYPPQSIFDLQSTEDTHQLDVYRRVDAF